MNRREMQSWARSKIDQILEVGNIEDDQVECKAILPIPDRDGAKRIGALANKCANSHFGIFVGISDKGQLVGTDRVDLADWYPKIRGGFDGPAPE
ncbi:MAG: hypothetical protein SFZ24_02105, partial [Planctomycetota bacterium]|nr:hypothetical protein [Planctomycetota bacterium]